MSNRIRITLRRRFLLHNLLLVAALFLAGGICIWRMGILRRDVEMPKNVYAELQTVGNVGIEVGTVRGLLTAPEVNRDAIVTRLSYAIGGLDQFIQVGKGYGGERDDVMRSAYVPINQSAQIARDRLQTVLAAFKSGPPVGDAKIQREAIDEASNDLGHVASSCIRFMSIRQEAAAGGMTAIAGWIGGLSLAAVLAAILLSIVQDRLVMSPLERLREGVRRVAAARFSEKMDLAAMTRTPEFIELGSEFNRMAEEIDGFYRKLESQVREKSRELVRSERLASVGFLAAGVAHEINNPLNIISGHAELTTKLLSRDPARLDDEALEQARASLRLICEEAFRCKEITGKLLSLSRNGSESRESLDLSGVARDVIAMTQGLPHYRDRQLTLKLDSGPPLQVKANLTEMKQVLLNLTINALESVSPVKGEVRIEGRRTGDWIELHVQDNGRGMTPDVLRHVFEPFFTARSGKSDGRSGERGTGLGLSITHAIIENHGGQIRVESDGPGRGAHFTIRLPPAAMN